MRSARWFLSLVSLALVLLVVWWEIGGVEQGPGPLHPMHARLPRLAEGRTCEACHAAGAGVSVAGCTTCHTAIGTQLAELRGLHGALAPTAAQRCGSCHGEHHGDEVPLLAPHAFPAAGVPDAAAYDHRHVAFGLTGAHGKLACKQCHPAAERADPAGPRFLGAGQACTGCHQDPHQQAYGAACAECHGQDGPWAAVPGLPHGSFPLRDAHARVGCAECHPAGGEHAVAALRATPQPPRACRACHADPHGAEPAATTLRLADAGDCARCHDAKAWATARPDLDRHATFGAPLLGAHAQVDCQACHGRGPRPDRWRGQAPAMTECAACHADPHRPALVAAAACVDCHPASAAAFAAGTLTPAQHAGVFPLAVPHAGLDCRSCHRGSTFAERYPGREPAACGRCHTDVHQGQFAAHGSAGTCTACHAGAHFVPSTFGVTAHAATRFPLRGAHDAVACGACHPAVAGGPRVFHGLGTACADCHTDVHHGRFDAPGRPGEVSGAAGCARCHDENAFSPVPGFDHDRWTGYELAGAHARVDCTECHPPAANRRQRLGPALGTACADCHADPHAAQFAVEGRTDCTRCHAATTFADRHFDHQRTAFPLDTTHAAVPCATCHRPEPVRGVPVPRYKPLGTQCGDCHRLGGGGGR